jgi:quercetin dioxygenase-like cupin family protein
MVRGHPEDAMPRRSLLIACLLAGICAAGSAAQTESGQAHVMKTPSELAWGEAPPSLPPGAKAVMLEGDPTKEGYFAMRIRMPAGYRIPPHFHPTFERVTVIEGTFLLGMGDAFDEAAMQSWPVGSYLAMPAGMHHYALAKSECVVQLATLGPWGITYLDPADDPRSQPAKK